jgi:hypothetical protein
MLAFQSNSTLFSHIIAANSLREAIDITYMIGAEGHCQIRVLETPDIWTRRAVDMALAPGIIDTIPRFVVDREDGPVYLDIDDIPGKLRHGEALKMAHDSDMHDAWLDAMHAERERGVILRRHVAIAVAAHEPLRFTLTRALAGAWGLGPIPEWHAAILPALIALDIETTDCVNAFCDSVFELDIVELCHELSRCYSLSEYVPTWCKEALRQTMNCLAGQSSIAEIRATCLDVLTLTNWLP